MFLKLEVDIYSIYGYILGYIEENTIQVGNIPHNNGDKWPVVSKKKNMPVMMYFQSTIWSHSGNLSQSLPVSLSYERSFSISVHQKGLLKRKCQPWIVWLLWRWENFCASTFWVKSKLLQYLFNQNTMTVSVFGNDGKIDTAHEVVNGSRSQCDGQHNRKYLWDIC